MHFVENPYSLPKYRQNEKKQDTLSPLQKAPNPRICNNGPEIGGAATDEIKDWLAYEIEHIERLNLLSMRVINKKPTEFARKTKVLHRAKEKQRKDRPATGRSLLFKGE